MGECPGRKELEQMLAGQLETPVEEILCDHVELCSACQKALELLVDRNRPRGLTTQVRHASSLTEPSFNIQFEQNPPVSVPALLPGLEQATRRRVSSVSTQSSGSKLPAPALPGYEILEELGRGGMGVVYRARQIALNRFVAVKTILAGDHADVHERARFQVEAEAAAGLQHPHIVQVHEVGEHEGRPFFSMELIEGVTLQEKFQGRPQLPREGAELIELLARAVHFAHERGIVHRDLKPANILIQRQAKAGDRFETPKITDFGLAKFLSGEMRYTRTGVVLGTPEYMAPEQAAGTGQPVGPACDIYALGVLLYQALTGRVPITAATAVETLLLVRNEEPLPIGRLQPRVPPDLQTITHKCLQKEAGRRYASARDLADDLRRFLEDRPILGRPPSIFYQWRQVARRHKGLVGGSAAVAAALAVGAVVSIIFALGEAEQRRAADDHARQAEASAARATALTGAVDEARRLALRQAYDARLASAQIALGQGNHVEAAAQLEGAPAELRGWEWQHLHARLLDRQPARFPLGEKFGAVSGFFPAVPQVRTKRDDRLRLVDARTSTVAVDWPVGEPVFIQGKLHLARLEAGSALRLLDLAGQERRIGPVRKSTSFEEFVLSPDGAWLATWMPLEKDLFQVVCYDLATGQSLWKATAPLQKYPPIFSPDSQRLATLGVGNAVSLRMSKTGELRELKGHTARITHLAFSPDGTHLTSSSEDGSVRQWDVQSGAPLFLRQSQYTFGRTLAYSPDGRWLAAGNNDRTISVWPAKTTDAGVFLHPGGDDIHHVGFSPDASTLGMVDATGTVYLMTAPGEVDPAVLRGHNRYVYPVAFSPDGRWIVSGGWENEARGMLRFWDARTGAAIPELTTPMPSYVGALAVTPDSEQVIVADGTDGLYHYRLGSGELRRFIDSPGISYQGLSHTHTISPDGRWVWWGNQNQLHRWDIVQGRELPGYSVPIASVRHLLFSPDGRHLAAAGSNALALLDAESGRVEWTAPKNGNSLAFSADGRRLVTSDGCLIYLWDAQTGQLLRTLTGHTGSIFATVFHPDGTRLASGGRDRAIHIWDCTTGDLLARLQGHTSYVFSLAFSPDGRTLVSGSGDYTVRLWDTQPVADRLRARRETEAVRPEAERLVQRMLADEADPVRVLTRLRSDAKVNEPLQRAAWQALLRQRAGGTRHE